MGSIVLPFEIKNEISVLARGLTFCPIPRPINWPEIVADIYDFVRRMRLTEFFFDETNTTKVNKRDNPSHNKSTWNPPTNREQPLDTFLDAVKLDNLTLTILPPQNDRQYIIIKPADKGSGTVIMDKTWYIDECNRQLNDSKFYRRLNEDITADIQKRVTVYVNRMYTDDLFDEKTKQYLIQPDVKPGRFLHPSQSTQAR